VPVYGIHSENGHEITRKKMDSILKIKYYIYGMVGNKCVETDSREEARASFEEGKIVYEGHITTWKTPQGISGKNEVRYEWQQPDIGD
jgi:hypothetical protein